MKKYVIGLMLLIPLFVLLSSAPAKSAESASEESMMSRRARLEKQWILDGLYLLPHKPNYFLPVSYNMTPSNQPFNDVRDVESKNFEAKFQLSVKLSLVRGLIRNKGHLYFGYTQLSMWQLYDREYSSPFRDTNYEPELFAVFETHKPIGSWTNKMVTLGLTHQSNGRSRPYSRSWNRIYSVFALEKGNKVLSLKPWIQLPAAHGDEDNPDIEKYMGYGEVRLVITMKRQTLSFMGRNNLSIDNNKGAFEMGYSFPLSHSLKGFVQYFTGYGESLLDYNHANNRLGVGFALTDWL